MLFKSARKHEIFIISLSLIVSSLSQVRSSRPPIQKCLQKDLATILKIMTLSAQSSDRNMPPLTKNEVEQKVKSMLQMIKTSLEPSNSNIPSRRTFPVKWRHRLWRPRWWRPRPFAIGAGAGIYGGYRPGGGFGIGAGLGIGAYRPKPVPPYGGSQGVSVAGIGAGAGAAYYPGIGIGVGAGAGAGYFPGLGNGAVGIPGGAYYPSSGNGGAAGTNGDHQPSSGNGAGSGSNGAYQPSSGNGAVPGSNGIHQPTSGNGAVPGNGAYQPSSGNGAGSGSNGAYQPSSGNGAVPGSNDIHQPTSGNGAVPGNDAYQPSSGNGAHQPSSGNGAGSGANGAYFPTSGEGHVGAGPQSPSGNIDRYYPPPAGYEPHRWDDIIPNEIGNYPMNNPGNPPAPNDLENLHTGPSNGMTDLGPSAVGLNDRPNHIVGYDRKLGSNSYGKNTPHSHFRPNVPLQNYQPFYGDYGSYGNHYIGSGYPTIDNGQNKNKVLQWYWNRQNQVPTNKHGYNDVNDQDEAFDGKDSNIEDQQFFYDGDETDSGGSSDDQFFDLRRHSQRNDDVSRNKRVESLHRKSGIMNSFRRSRKIN